MGVLEVRSNVQTQTENCHCRPLWLGHALFDFAFARLDHAESKRREFGESWKQYISHHPWDIDVRNVTPTTF